MKLFFLASLLAVAGCATLRTSDDAASGTGPSPEAGTSETGAATPDPDDDSGPDWDGSVPATPSRIASHVTSFAITRDDEVVFASTGAGVSVILAAGGATTSIGTDANVTIARAGRAAIVQKSTDGTLMAWTQAAGLRAMTGITLGAGEQIGAIDTESGDFALLSTSSGAAWFFDATALTTMAIDSLPTNAARVCRPTGETIACLQASADQASITVFTVDRQGVHLRATQTGKVTLGPFVVNGDLIYSNGSSAYRLAAGATTPTVLVPGATDVAAVQDDWIAATAPDGVHVLKADGSQAKTVASESGARLEAFTTNSQLDHDSARIRWVGICDDAPMGQGTNLRVYDPATGRTVSLSKTGCDLRAVTYSDNFAFFIDGAHYVNDPVVQEAGDPTVIDLRDGSSRGNPTGMTYFDHAAIPVGKSRLLFSWLAFSVYNYGAYYDGHGAPSNGAASLGSLTTFRLLSANGGVVLPTVAGDGTEGDLFTMPLP